MYGGRILDKNLAKCLSGSATAGLYVTLKDLVIRWHERLCLRTVEATLRDGWVHDVGNLASVTFPGL